MWECREGVRTWRAGMRELDQGVRTLGTGRDTSGAAVRTGGDVRGANARDVRERDAARGDIGCCACEMALARLSLSGAMREGRAQIAWRRA
jgi:hypothetical protein